jgi:hypothetical protein
MIKFKALMQAIHQSIQSASKSVEYQGIKYINDFFEVVEPDDSKTKGVSDKKNQKIYRPKTLPMEFPSRTPDGVETVIAEVPLITLSPISSPRISEVKFVTDLEISTDQDGELLVSFPHPKKRGLFSGSDNHEASSSRIEITLKGNEPPEGLKKLIEGYERALRAQIPG